tara:strand:- start:216 stop:395 length:180 start_codon:yes stop_codon:yes gene_type:complete
MIAFKVVRHSKNIFKKKTNLISIMDIIIFKKTGEVYFKKKFFFPFNMLSQVSKLKIVKI